MQNSTFNDGANWQAQAVAAFLTENCVIENSWDENSCQYKAEPKIARWYNCREQGYIVSLSICGTKNMRQLNIAFFEHRNFDSICAVRWEQVSINPLTIDTAKFGEIYKDKYDTSFDVGYGKIVEMGDWINGQLNAFYDNSVEAEL